VAINGNVELNSVALLSVCLCVCFSGRQEKEYEMTLKRTLQSICLLTVHPNTTTSVILQVRLPPLLSTMACACIDCFAAMMIPGCRKCCVPLCIVHCCIRC
jgi:exosome complex component RRP46